MSDVEKIAEILERERILRRYCGGPDVTEEEVRADGGLMAIRRKLYLESVANRFWEEALSE